MDKKEKVNNRRLKLIEIIKRKKFMAITELAFKLGVSTSTISDDIRSLKPQYPNLYSQSGQNGGVGWKNKDNKKYYKYIFALDPSGNFEEGKGTTGWVLMDADENLIERGYISAKDYECTEAYWNAHLDLLRKYNKLYKNELIVVIEEYVLYRDRSKDQTNSKMETCRLLGLLQWNCWRHNMKYSMQLATSVKHRWSDELLLREGILRKEGKNLIHTQSDLSLGLIHTRDAFRHAIHYAICRNKKHEKQYEYEQPNKLSNY